MTVSRPSAVVALLFVGVACQTASTDVIPNRVLDRPLDVALGCYAVVQPPEDDGAEGGGDGEYRPGTVLAAPLSSCAYIDPPSCSASGEDEFQLLGFIANSDRSELGMFRLCDREAGVVDISRNVPGYNMLPVGRLPSRVVATNQGCTVVTANYGSCDLSIVDAQGLAAYGLAGATEPTPSRLRSDLVPRRSDDSPIAARPGDLLALPESLSSLPGSALPRVGCADDGSDDTVLVTFPACHLVAELSLATQRILQSRRFVDGDGDGTIDVIDTGTSPQCPVECPEQLDDDDARDPPPVGRGIYPVALAIEDVDEPGGVDGADALFPRSSFFVGGSESNEIFEIEIGRDGRWVPPEQTLRLELGDPEPVRQPDDPKPVVRLDPKGVLAIRPTPIATLAGQRQQFVYVITGDGSTHVVQRSEAADTLGRECDTQVDPSGIIETAQQPSCSPLAVDLRRSTALGPGIRSPDGAAITDWAFFAYDPAGEGTPDADPDEDQGVAPFRGAEPQVVGVGSTSSGRIIYVAIDAFQGQGQFSTADPAQIMDISLRPHTLWPELDPNQSVGALPRVEDEVPDRALPGPEDTSQILSPALRRIDLAYAPPDDDDGQSQQSQINRSLGQPTNADDLGNRDGERLYENDVVRVVARDYTTWAASGQGSDLQTWSFRWEGQIPGSQSGFGRIDCDATVPGWNRALCERGAATLVDDGAEFCDRGVLAGDVLTIVGCSTDGGCGEGQRCLRDPNSSTASGICVSAKSYAEDRERLLVYCAPFINGPCGFSEREFSIRKAYRNRLELDPLPIGRTAHLREGEDGRPVELAGEYTCLPALASDDAITCLDTSDCVDAGLEAGAVACAVDGVCRQCSRGDPECRQCNEDADCSTDYGEEALCSDGRCRRPCAEDTSECLRAPLPGNLCFPELVSYSVRLRNEFLVEGNPAFAFFSDRVATAANDECVVNRDVSTLLTSRLPIANEDGSALELPDCDETATLWGANPCSIRRPRAPDPISTFHTFQYFPPMESEVTVPAVRFSNPFMSVVMDLVNLDAIARTPSGFSDGSGYGGAFATFESGRIPDNYRESFRMRTGFLPFAEQLVGGNSTPLIYPVRIVKGPTSAASGGSDVTAYVVDAGGRPGGTEVRGQIIRIIPSRIDAGRIDDELFRVR